jgi:hypothetical protein
MELEPNGERRGGMLKSGMLGQRLCIICTQTILDCRPQRGGGVPFWLHSHR